MLSKASRRCLLSNAREYVQPVLIDWRSFRSWRGFPKQLHSFGSHTLQVLLFSETLGRFSHERPDYESGRFVCLWQRNERSGRLYTGTHRR